MYKQQTSFGSRRGLSSSRGRVYSSSRGGSRRGGNKPAIIDPKRFVKVASTPAPQDVFMPLHTFADFNFHPLIASNLAKKGYEQPSPIQDQTIPIGLAGSDVIGIANTGTGKTAAFALPALHRLLTEKNQAVIIIAPTRELAQQIEQECRSFAIGSGLAGALLIGGTAMQPQLRDLRNRPHIVIGTPGRIKDHLERGSLNLNQFTMCVLDEVDRMVDMGFITDIRFILSKLATQRQSYFFSATLDHKLESLVHSFMKDPVTISVKTGETTDSVHQDVVYYMSSSDKIEKLHNLLITHPNMKTLVFDATQRGVERLGKELMTRGFRAESIHGGKSQGQRQRALASFKRGEIDILVATDVAARGLDISDITHVVNFSQPNSYDDYVHRIGRAGRAGRIGYAFTFVSKPY